MSDGRKICFRFQNTGRCQYGDKCKFDHGHHNQTHHSSRPQRSNNRSDRPVSTSEADYRVWLRNIPLDNRRAYPLQSSLANFFQEASRLVSIDSTTMQDVVKKLASEGGLLRIKELLEKDDHCPPTVMKPQVFKEQILPFFNTITKPDILDSLILEADVARLYNFIFGINGARAASLFTFVADVLASIERLDESFVSMLERSIVVFSKVLDYNTLAAVQPTLQEAAKQVERIFAAASEGHDAGDLTMCAEHLQGLLRRLNLGISIPVTTLAATKQPRRSATAFPIRIEPPGGRHDNDFADVCKISILPTLAEIRSGRGEYLPDKDPSQWHVPGVDGLLDRSFRLLREDTVGQLRDAIQHQLEHQGASWKTNLRNGIRTNVYTGASVVSLFVGRPSGFRLTIQFEVPAKAKQLSAAEQADWWKRSQRLQSEALVCLVNEKGVAIFCTVRDSPSNPKTQGEDKDRAGALKFGLTCASLSLVEQNEANMQHVLEQYVQGGKAAGFSLVEFPKILLPAFEPTLRALQKIKKLGQLPFANLLAPSEPQALVDVPPPVYARRRGFSFNLSPLVGGSELRLVVGTPFEVDDLIQKSTLDRAQASGLVDALSRQFSLIQGPPGTGKSYTGVAALKVILASKRVSSNLGPIICITYTNHALDQVLEDVLDSGITTKVIRMGSQSKSARLADHNLRIVAGKTAKTRGERWDLHTAYDQMNHTVASFESACNALRKHSSPSSIRDFLRDRRPDYYNHLFGKDEEGFQRVGGKNPEKVFRAWLQAGVSDCGQAARSTNQLSRLSKKERHGKYYGWIKTLRTGLEDQMKSAISEFRIMQERQQNVHDECDLRCLREADIIGVTTSGLARKIEVLRRVNAKILLCEEAGEVLEAHLLAAFLPGLEHVILIGDHQQLRPQVQNFLELSRESARGKARSLDVSLFERLVQPDVDGAVKLPYSTLEIQRRMHPSIAELIRETLYPSLQDEESVTAYPEVAGMRKRLFWLDHNEFESKQSDDVAAGSHWNDFEIEMVTAVVMHLIQQGSYGAGDIAVLTPYLGQLHRLRRRLQGVVAISLSERDESDLAQEGLIDEPTVSPQVAKSSLLQTLRVATIDNFQGEEAKVVVISLVRSNAQGNCGFLKTSNRINVLLSRAKHGMYILGNSRTSMGVKMWADVIRMLRDKDNFGSELELHCPRHPAKEMRVKTPEDFTVMSPEGGCNERCGNRLTCGHACLKRCHSNLMHRAVHCLESCQRPMNGCDHPCPKPCGDACPKKCVVVVSDPDRKLQCGHSAVTLPCWQAQDISSVVCRVRVERTIPGCNHIVNEPCFRDVADSSYFCRTKCSQLLSCGHACKRNCCNCRSIDQEGTVNIDHGQCTQVCGRQYSTCAHRCKQSCHGVEPCGPCSAPCNVRCAHSCCAKICSEPCTPCAEAKCPSACPHSSCSLPCAAPCDHVPCSKRCSEMLACGHKCPSTCGEACPDARFCQTCAVDAIKTTEVDFLEGKQYQDIDLDQTPCIFPTCGHFLTLESMDGLMSMEDHYVISEVNEVPVPIKVKSTSQPFSMTDIKTCPMCRGPLRNLARYGRLIRRALLDESTKKLILWSNQEFVRLYDQLPQQLQLIKDIEAKEPPATLSEHNPKAFPGSRGTQVLSVGYVLVLYDRRVWNRINAFRREIIAYRQRAKQSEQPFSKVRNAVDTIRRRTGRQVTFSFDESILQTKGFVLATSLLLRLDLALLVSFLSLKQPVGPSSSRAQLDIGFDVWEKDCHEFLAEAAATERVPQQVEAYTYLAQLCAIRRSSASEGRTEEFRIEGMEHLRKSRDLCISNPQQTRGLLNDIEAVEAMLHESTFYSPVSTEERRAVIQAMATEMQGTGHWYYCENGHPFTIGECGMPMERATCHECSAPVGGHHHQSVAGNTHASDLERQFSGLGIGL